jgi:hypothetical protein
MSSLAAPKRSRTEAKTDAKQSENWIVADCCILHIFSFMTGRELLRTLTLSKNSKFTRHAYVQALSKRNYLHDWEWDSAEDSIIQGSSASANNWFTRYRLRAATESRWMLFSCQAIVEASAPLFKEPGYHIGPNLGDHPCGRWLEGNNSLVSFSRDDASFHFVDATLQFGTAVAAFKDASVACLKTALLCTNQLAIVPYYNETTDKPIRILSKGLVQVR